MQTKGRIQAIKRYIRLRKFLTSNKYKMADSKKSWLWVLLIVIVLALVWLRKTGAMNGSVNDAVTGAINTVVEGGQNDAVPNGGPKVQICINNGGTWNQKKGVCDLPEGNEMPTEEEADALIETGVDNPVEPGDNDTNSGLILNASGEVVVGE